MSLKRLTVPMVAIFSILLLALAFSMPAMAQGEPPEDVFWMFGAIWCLIPLVSIVIWVVVAIWAYRDANERGMSGVLWAIVIVIGGLLGLIVYLIIRRDHPKYGEPGYGYRAGYPGYYHQPYYYGPRYPPPGYPPPRYPPY